MKIKRYRNGNLVSTNDKPKRILKRSKKEAIDQRNLQRKRKPCGCRKNRK